MVEEDKKKILITGISGMLGEALVCRFAKKYALAGLDSKSIKTTVENFFICDITDQEKLQHAFLNFNPWLVIHAAAYTNVDGCEQFSQKANQINAHGTKNICILCKKIDAKLIYISTDYVFDGERGSPYREEDTPDPINTYGRSKLKGEKFIQEVMDKFLIIRTSWLFGRQGKNFVDTILEKIKLENELKVIDDQKGSPTYTVDLAEAIDRLIEVAFLADFDYYKLGIYHISNSGSCSWYELAKKIIELKKLNKKILPITSSEAARAAKRPKFSVLSNYRYQSITGHKLPDWQDALQRYLT